VSVTAIFVTDRRGLDLARFSIASFIYSQTSKPDLTLYCDGFALAPDDVLFRLAADAGFRFTARPISSAMYAASRTDHHISTTTYAKLAAAIDAAKSYDRVFYTDFDILYFAPLPLLTLDFQGFPLAAAFDVSETTSVTDRHFEENCAASGVSKNYFNAGVLFIDAANCDLASLEAKYSEEVKKHDAHCLYKADCTTGDQCVWNTLFADNWLFLPISWNVQSSMRFTPAWQTAAARHYTGPVKFLPVRPWRSDAREAHYIRFLGSKLGHEVRAGALPFDLLFHLNGLRWRRSTTAITASIAEVNARIAGQFSGDRPANTICVEDGGAP
jgi:lipopolysaccharide biosynthesis glycosyltransferase